MFKRHCMRNPGTDGNLNISNIDTAACTQHYKLYSDLFVTLQVTRCLKFTKCSVEFNFLATVLRFRLAMAAGAHTGLHIYLILPGSLMQLPPKDACATKWDGNCAHPFWPCKSCHPFVYIMIWLQDTSCQCYIYIDHFPKWNVYPPQIWPIYYRLLMQIKNSILLLHWMGFTIWTLNVMYGGSRIFWSRWICDRISVTIISPIMRLGE